MTEQEKAVKWDADYKREYMKVWREQHKEHRAAYQARWLRFGPQGCALTRERWLQWLGVKFVPEPNSGCWLWAGALSKNGRAYIKHGGRSLIAHRVSYKLLRGPIPPGLELDHLCRTPSCVNPDHLEPVTRAVNSLRARKTHCLRGHPFDEANTRVEACNGRPRRQCRACQRDRQRGAA